MTLRKSIWYYLAFVVAVILLFNGCASPSNNRPPGVLTDSAKREPDNALRGLTVAEDLQADLFAHEPMLTNPTNIDVDEKGRVWVCEGYNYRNQYNPQNPYRSEGDRIVILEDTNGDGVADKQTTFYQGTDIDAALGIAVLGNKVVVSRSPNVYVFTDEDGDGKADRKDTLFTAIGGVQHDHAIHAFNFGPDGKLYFNFGNEGHSIRDKHGKEIIDLSGHIVNNSGKPYRQGMVFRCNPDGSEFEVLGHNFRNNYEVSEDSYGTMWQSDNDDDGNRGVRINYVMPFGNFGYTDEITGASWSEHRINMEDSIPYRHWHLNDPGVVPNLLQTGAGSPTGILVYEGDLLPARFHNQIIHADAGPNVVRSYAVSADGAGYSATINNILQGTGDDWFRPSDVCVGPDGSLFIADWYDPGVGGHQVRDLSRGRIYRVTPLGHRGYEIPRIDLSSPAGAATALGSPNISTRFLAWQKLHSLGDGAIGALEGLYRSSNQRMRARALWLLTKIPGRGISYAQRALQDSNENIRITGLRAICELHADTLGAIRGILNDPSAAVRREAAISLRNCQQAGAAQSWATLAAQYDGKDRWYLEALGIGADGQWDGYFSAWLKLKQGEWNTTAGRNLIWRARTALALPYLAKILSDPAKNPKDQLKFFRAFDFIPDKAKQGVLFGLLEGHHPQQNLIDEYVLLLVKEVKPPASPKLKTIIDSGLAAAKGSREYVEILRKFQIRDKNQELLSLATDARDLDLQSEALKVLLSNGGQPLVDQVLARKDESSRRLIKSLGDIESRNTKSILASLLGNGQFGFTWRKDALYALANDWTGEDMLLDMAKNTRIPPDLRDSAGVILLNASRDSIRRTAAVYFKTGARAASNQIGPIEKLAHLTGDAIAGKAVFSAYCASCHQVNGSGINFGPNLSEIGAKLSIESIYAAILQPSAGISFGFEGYVFTLKNGMQVLGYIASETSDEVSIKKIGGLTEKHLKTEIADKKPYGKSLMTEGLPQAMGQQKLVDLVEFLRTLKKANP